MPVTLGSFNLRWHASVRSGGRAPIGSWYDSLCTSPASYVEQARQSVVAGSPEHFLFEYSELATRDVGKAAAAALRDAMPDLRRAHAALSGEVPVGVAAYKPVNSHAGCEGGSDAPRDQPCEGEAHIFDFVAALGVPLLPTHAWPPAKGMPAAAFFSAHGLKDPKLADHLTEAAGAGVELLLTDGLLARLPKALAASLRALPTVHELPVKNDPKALLVYPPPASLPATRTALLARLGLSLRAPTTWVGFYPFAGGKWALMNLNPDGFIPMDAGVGGWNGTIAARGWHVEA
jgi:hypothetical protein